jgi:hypothetical protein
MNRDQGGGIIERAIYSSVLFFAMKLVAAGYIDADMAAYIASGSVLLFGGAYAWWHNRPVSVINRAAAAVPESARLVIETPVSAPHADRLEARELGEATIDKVTAKTTPT